MRWLLLSLLLTGAVPAQAQEHAALADVSPGRCDASRVGADYARFASAMAAGMDAMMRDMHAPGCTGNADVDFLAMMIAHHAGAVEMARLLLIHGRDPLTRKLAEDIIASQLAEIEGMKRRLALLRAGPEQGDFPALGGTRGPAP